MIEAEIPRSGRESQVCEVDAGRAYCTQDGGGGGTVAMMFGPSTVPAVASYSTYRSKMRSNDLSSL